MGQQTLIVYIVGSIDFVTNIKHVIIFSWDTLYIFRPY